MSDMPDVKHGPDWRPSLLTLMVVIPAILLLAYFLGWSIHRARQAAWQSQSKNNLKQIGLAFHNYHDTNETLPPGGLFNHAGVPFHGWSTSLAPYFDASPWYNMVNMSVPWDDPSQLDLFFKNPHRVLQNPRISSAPRSDQLPVSQYAGNSWLMYRNSSVTLKDIGDLQNTLLAGESHGNFPPCGLPGNWRDVQAGLNASADAFGMTGVVTQVLLADGSVRAINSEVAPAIWNTLAGPANSKPTVEQLLRPAIPADLSKVPLWHNRRIWDGKVSIATFSLSPDGMTLNATFPEWSLARDRLSLSDESVRELESLGHITHIKIDGVVKIDEIERLSRSSNLQKLTLSSAKVEGNLEAFRKGLRKSVILD